MGPTHAQLSEPSVSEHVLTHDRKGREGKGMGGEGNRKGCRGETSSIASGYASARAATEPSDTHQPHAIAPSWMRADR